VCSKRAQAAEIGHPRSQLLRREAAQSSLNNRVLNAQNPRNAGVIPNTVHHGTSSYDRDGVLAVLISVFYFKNYFEFDRYSERQARHSVNQANRKAVFTEDIPQ